MIFRQNIGKVTNEKIHKIRIQDYESFKNDQTPEYLQNENTIYTND